VGKIYSCRSVGCFAQEQAVELIAHEYLLAGFMVMHRDEGD
jgi:hypothetical protein